MFYPCASKSVWLNVVLPDQAIAFTRRPVKDKGALMQTLHLRLRDLRAIFLRLRPSRWPTPSMLQASTWKGALPLPNLPRPTLAVGAHPATSRQQFDRCPTVGAGLPLALTFRETSRCGAVAPARGQVCWSQTAENNPYPAALHMAGQGVGCSLQAPFSEVRCTPSNGLSFSIRPQRYGARAGWKKTPGPEANVVALAEISKGARWLLCQRVR
jgi:hypothetical protein